MRLRLLIRLFIVTLVAQTTLAQTTQPTTAPATQPAEQKLPPGSRKIMNLSYIESGHARQKLDLYLPREAADHPVPVVIYIHGGGWSSGNRSNPPASMLLSHGYALASVEHRFSSDALFPAQIHDVEAAVRWLGAHAGQYNLDKTRYASWGASSGGELALLLGVGSGVKEVEGNLGGNLDQPTRMRCVIDYFGTVEFRKPREYPLNKNRTNLLGGTPEEKPELAALATPITHITPDDAPVLILHGDADKTVTISHSEELEAELKRTNVEVKFIRIPGAGHGGPEFTSPESFQIVADFLDAHLKSK